jgi:hypothetical protein
MRKFGPVLLSAAIVILVVAIAHAEIRVTVSRFDHNQLHIEGQTAPNNTVTIDGKFKTQSDSSGYFKFNQTSYRPDDCMSDIRSGSDIYSAVIAGCFGEFAIEREGLKTPAPD